MEKDDTTLAEKSTILEDFSRIPKRVLANAARMRENAHTKAVVEISKSGGDMSTASLVLKPLTNYLLRLTNVSGAAQAAEMTITWYE